MIVYALITILVVIVANELLKNSTWYISKYEDSAKFKNINRNIDIINIGSNPSKYGFDYSDSELNGMNCAVGPETLSYDFKVLQKMLPYMKKNGTAIILLSPLSSILDNYKHVEASDKYYHFLPSHQILNYSNKRKLYICLFNYFPIVEIVRNPRIIKTILRRVNDKSKLAYNPMSVDDLERDANNWLNGWSKQFEFKSLEDNIRQEHAEIQDDNIEIAINMIEACRANSVIPVIVLPPISTFLNSKFSSKFKDLYIYDFIRKIKDNSDIDVLDYMDNKEYQNPSLYYNSFFLNKKGRLIFTNDVINNIIQAKEKC